MFHSDDAAGIKVLSEAEFRAAAQRAFSAVFRSDDPFNEPFERRVPPRGLLYPFGPALEHHELEAVRLSVASVGEQGFFLSITERPPEERRGEYPFDWHWWISLDAVGGYPRLRFPGVLQNALYSEHGRWGILCSNEQHAVVGGPPRFLDVLYANLPQPEAAQARQFAADWKQANEAQGYRVDWVPRVLAHVYGPERAEAILRAVGFPSDPSRWIGRYPRPGDRL